MRVITLQQAPESNDASTTIKTPPPRAVDETSIALQHSARGIISSAVASACAERRRGRVVAELSDRSTYTTRLSVSLASATRLRCSLMPMMVSIANAASVGASKSALSIAQTKGVAVPTRRQPILRQAPTLLSLAQLPDVLGKRKR